MRAGKSHLINGLLGEITTVFIVKSDAVDHAYWDERGPLPDVEYGDDFALPRLALYFLPDLLTVMSCLDRDAWAEVGDLADSYWPPPVRPDAVSEAGAAAGVPSHRGDRRVVASAPSAKGQGRGDATGRHAQLRAVADRLGRGHCQRQRDDGPARVAELQPSVAPGSGTSRRQARRGVQ